MFLLLILGLDPEDPKVGLPDGIFSNQKISIWVIFGVSCNGMCRPFGILFGYLDFFLFWYKKNLTTLSRRRFNESAKPKIVE
jgi:hypothetical protein